MKKTGLRLLAWLSTLIPLLSFAISNPNSFWGVQTYGTDDAFLYRQHPIDSDFSHIELRRSISSYPMTIAEGDFVISGTQYFYNDTAALEGSNYYSVFAVDLSGNVSDPANTLVYIDTTWPTFSYPWLTGVTLGSGWITAQRAVSDPSNITTFRYQIVAYNSTWASLIDYTINDLSQTGYTGSLWLDKAFIDAGGTGWDYIFLYTATDTYGNQTLRQLSFTYDPQYLADTTGPVVSGLLPSSGQVVPGNIPFSWTVSDPTLPGWYIAFRIAGDVGLTQLAYQAGVFITDFNTTQTLTGTVSLAEGSYYRWSTVADYLGNQTTTPSTPFTVDATAPILTYTSPIVNSWYILSGQSAIITAEAYDVHLDGGHIHTFIGTTPDFDDTRPVGGLFHGGNTPADTTSEWGLTIPNLPVGTYYRYTEANDIVGNTIKWAMQSFTVVAQLPSQWVGGGGGYTQVDTCSYGDFSSSFYDNKCFDTTIPATHRQKILNTYNSGAVVTDTDSVSLYGFITDVFTLLNITPRRPIGEKFKAAPITERIYIQILNLLNNRLKK